MSEKLLGKNNKSVVTVFRTCEDFDRIAKRKELEAVIVLTKQYIQQSPRSSLDKYIKSKTNLSFEDIYKDIQLLILSGFLEVRIKEDGGRVYSFTKESNDEIKEICAKNRVKKYKEKER